VINPVPRGLRAMRSWHGEIIELILAPVLHTNTLVAYATDPHRYAMCHPSEIAGSILDTVGNTPLVRLDRFLDRQDVEVFAKLEMGNPAGSSKDRPALRMLSKALQEGRVQRGGLVVESSSGNMAIAMAQFCGLHDLRFKCVVDRRTQSTNLQLLGAYGAEIEFIEDADGLATSPLTARMRRVAEIVASTPGSYWPNQHANEENPAAHDHGTMSEIWTAMGGRVDCLFVPVSTTGTALGCKRFIDRMGSPTRIIAVDAEGSVIFGGRPGPRPIPGLGASHRPPLVEDSVFDAVERVSPLDCVVGCRRLVRRESILAGGSSGGALQAVRRRARRLRPTSRVAVVLPDDGSRYLDTVFSDRWVAGTLGCPPGELRRLVDAPDGLSPKALLSHNTPPASTKPAWIEVS